jgi:cobalt-zinc-cadmium efflux system membrane fusion protein
MVVGMSTSKEEMPVKSKYWRYRLIEAMACLATIASLSSCQAPEMNEPSAQAVKNANVITVTKDVANDIGLTTEPVVYHSLKIPLHVTGQIHPEIGKEVDVNTRSSGRVIKIFVKLGDTVNLGQALAEVDSQQISDLQAELIEAKSKLSIAQAQEDREKSIYQEQLSRPKTLIQAKTHFDETKVRLDLAEAEFKRQEELYKEKITSLKGFMAARGDFEQAKLAFRQAVSELQREDRLYQNKAMLKKDYQLAAAETARAKQHLHTLTQRLIFLGMSKEVADHCLKTGKISGSIILRASAPGIITHQDIAIGEMVDPGKRAFTITDLFSVIVGADIPEVDLAKVKIGSEVKVKIASYPDYLFSGKIFYISENVNPDTRTVSIRARLPNPDRKLKTNMFAELDLMGEPRTVLACPKAAVQERDGNKVVYIEVPGGYIERKIEPGISSEKYYEVISGLKEGEKVVTQGSLMLKTELSYRH